MKTFSNHLNEQSLSDHDGILVIVDVQREFSSFIPQGYVEKLNTYCGEFPTVYQIWDCNKAQKPSWKFPNEKGAYVKKYGTTFSEELVALTKELEKKFPNAREGDRFKFKDVNSVVIRVKNNHHWFYINEDLVKLFKSLKGKSVIVIGGAENECLEDVYEGLESFGVKPTYNHEYIYSAQTNHNQIVSDPLQYKKK